jgi:hypothetical protein
MSSELAPESFDDAASRFSIFVGENGLPERIVWAQESDLVLDNHGFWLRERPPQAAWMRAREQYANGIRCGFGVLLHGFTTLPDATVAAVVFPRDGDVAQRHLMPRSGLKLSVLAKMRPSRLVRGSVRWWILSIRYRRQSRQFWNDWLELS